MHAKTAEKARTTALTAVAPSPNCQLQGYYMPTPVSSMMEELGFALLRLQAHRVCTSVVAEFQHALRVYADTKEVAQ
jgi:hypothetical protein